MILQNDLIRVELGDETGGFRSLKDLRLDREWVCAPDRSLLFRLMVPDGERECEHVDSDVPAVVPGGSSCVLTFARNGISMQAFLELDGDALVCRLQIVNDGPAPVEEIMFPYVRGLAPVEKACITWPHFHFRRIDDVFGRGLGGDHHSWNEMAQKYVGRYPHWLTTAWCDYGNDSSGIALEGRHKDFSIMDFCLHKVVEKHFDPVRRSLDLYTVHPHRVAPGETFTTPPVRIRLHEGDWHTVADEHRGWLDTWIGKPERPAQFAESIGWHFYFMKHQDGLEVNSYADLPRMAKSALAAGCRYLMVFGWQTGGHDNNYMYRYVPNDSWGGEAALKAALEECRQLGVQVIPFFNGTLANTQMPEHREYGYRWEAITRAGHPYYAGDWARNNFDAPSRNRSMLHHEVCFCEEYRPHFLDAVTRIVKDYGFGNTQLDQIAEKMFVCYNPSHGHGAPDRAFVDGLAALLPGVRKIVRDANPDGVIVGEGFNDFVNQWCDSSWTWRGLFDFPEAVLFSLPWLFASCEIDALEYGDANRAFAYKLQLDMKIDGGDGNISDYPEFCSFIKSHAELRSRVAPYYVYADFRDEENLAVRKPSGVFAKTYLNRNEGKVGVVIAETAGKPADVEFAHTWPTDERAARVWSSQGEMSQITVEGVVRMELRPFEVLVVCLDGVRTRHLPNVRKDLS
ncbi:MAG TPA: DUF6259 domain-containing protein [Candidatus Latescibacteria bacterium]|nr:DUF6259 domain-containing protein [Candidatus Latescibacterota bacterium]HQI75135.1 DUF6259 domain-containing protein [Candidatus Latescibacterota bacterium]HQK22926.1 DUF6259 domain-containing protein [Candidatus Latescibacterota bacterium]